MRHRLPPSALCLFTWLAWSCRPLDLEEKLSGKAPLAFQDVLPEPRARRFQNGRRHLLQMIGASFTSPAWAGDAPRELLLAQLQKRVDLARLDAAGAPLTPVNLDPATAKELTSLAERLEASFARQKNILQDPAKLQQLSGKWRLLFSDAPEITGLANLPLGLAVGPVYQPIDVSSKIFENQSPIVQKLGLVKGNLRVVGTFAAAPLRSVNAAGVVNTCGNRIDVNFERLVFSVDQLVGISTGSFLQRVATPTRAPGAPQPAIDITYLDDFLRITRGGDGSLFILVKEDAAGPDAGTREKLKKESGEEVAQGSGAVRWISTLGLGS